MATEHAERKMYIDGAWVDAHGGATMAVHDPATNAEIGHVPKGDRTDVGKAVDAAAAAFERPDWRAMDPAQRGLILRKMADLIRASADAIAQLETSNQGKPVKEAKGDVIYAAMTFDYYAGLADKIEGRTIPVPGTRLAFTVREPLGVTVHLVPWNYPFQLASRSVAPALAAGNTVIVKPASWTPLSALRLAEIGAQAGLPKGVLNVLTGPGGAVGHALVTHKAVRGVVLTGSVETGREVLRAAAERIIPVTLELGGKNPNILFADAELDKALRGIVRGAFSNAGQMCWACSRILAHESIYESVVEKLAAATAKLKIGPGADASTEMGPLVSKDHLASVVRHLEKGKAEGARLLTGGDRPADASLASGNFLRPAVVRDAAPDGYLARTEVFGPMLAVWPFKDLDDAVAKANATEFGLAAGIWTRDLKSAHDTARRLDAGIVSVNEYPITFPQTPFGGFKASGLGSEQGIDGIHFYTRLKAVTMNLR